MSITQFEQFKDFLTTAVQDTDFVRKNTILQDSTYLQTITDRIGALTPDLSLDLTYQEFESGLGLLLQDSINRTIAFRPKGFATSLSAYREGVVSEPRRIFRRAVVTDGVYYLLADGGIGATGTGVLLLNSNMDVLRRFPHFGTGVDEYEDASSVITFTIASTEYVAIADATHHVVQIYLYAAPYTLVATIGTLDTPGADADLLTAPNGLAVDTVNSLMYISCPTGQPAGATASNGFIAVYDLTVIGTPAYVSIPLFYSGTGSLLDSQVHTPVDLIYADDLLWVSNNGADHVGAFDVSGAAPLCARFVEAAGLGYQLRSPQQIFFRSTTGGFSSLYVVNSDAGTVEEFNALTYQHVSTYGIRATEDNLPVGYTRLSADVYGALGQPHGVVVDTISIDDQATNVMVVTDVGNKRVHRFNLDAYTDDNFVNFGVQTFGVPVIFDGWSISGNLPLDMVTVWYRFGVTEQFRKMANDTALPATRTVQFRLSVTLDSRKFIKTDWVVSRLRIHGRQA